ncbi:hypothetical protein N5C79_02175 [Pantoea brenneri]|uniref:hypothetical protein n=1 Tax=Pantoea brenneri TaxID=472694 RepID=UPI0024485B2A|nr:hypothetical protein [Pantoea brenneri]MDH1085296.1 hypothetical protein [Pantoea brenneri]
MAIVNELITKFGFIGNLAPQENFNANLKTSIGLLAGMGAAIAASAGGIAAWVTNISDSIDPMVQFSRETGIAIETVQTLGLAASVNGSSIDALQASLGEMTKRVGEFVATGQGEAKDVAARLGLQFRDLNGQVKSSDIIFRELADKIHGLSQAEKFSVLDKMGIDRSMVQLLSLTGDEIEGFQEKARALGVVTEEQANQFAAYNDSLTLLGKGFDGIRFQVAIGFVPALKELVDGFVDFLIANKELIQNGLKNLGEIIFSVTGMIKRLAPIVATITAGFLLWKIQAIGLRTVLATIFSPITLITAAVIGIVLVIDDLIVAMQDGQSVIADFFRDNWGIDIVPALKAAKAAVADFINYAKDSFKPLADAIISTFKLAWHLVTGAFTGDFQDAINDAQNIIDSLMSFIKGAFGVTGDAIKYVFGDAGEFIVSIFTTAVENVKRMFSSLWKLVTGDFTGAWEDASGVFTNTIDLWKKPFTAFVEWVKLLFSGLWKLVTEDFAGAWANVSKIFTNTVELWKKPFITFIDWVKALFAGLGDYIANTISNAASNAWTATKSFFGFGDDEKQGAGGAGGYGGNNGIPYGNPGLNGNLAYSTGGGSSSNSFSFGQNVYVTAPDAVAAGNAVVDSSQQQQKEAQRFFGRGGK